jgi:hypothetical protein
MHPASHPQPGSQLLQTQGDDTMSKTLARRLGWGAALPLFAAFFVSCVDAGVLQPLAPSPEPVLSGTFGATLVECPTDVERSATGIIGPLGGALELDGHSLILPAAAVLLPTEFQLTVPAGNYMQIAVTGNDQEHFEFLAPVSLTIDYSRCTRSNIDKEPLVVYHIEGSSKQLLKNMGGADDKVARRVTIGTDHLSDYAVAVP